MDPMMMMGNGRFFPFFLVGNDCAMMLPSLKQTLFVVVDLCLRSPLPQDLWLRRRICWSYMITGFNRILPRMWCKSKLAKCAHHKFEWVETQACDFRVKGLILWYVRGDQISLSGRIIKCRNGCQFWVICWYAVDSAVFRVGKTALCRCILRRHEEWRIKWIKSFFYKFQTFSTSSRSDFVHI